MLNMHLMLIYHRGHGIHCPRQDMPPSQSQILSMKSPSMLPIILINNLTLIGWQEPTVMILTPTGRENTSKGHSVMKGNSQGTYAMISLPSNILNQTRDLCVLG